MKVSRTLRTRTRQIRLAAGRILDSFGDPISEAVRKVVLHLRPDGSWGGEFHHGEPGSIFGNVFEADVTIDGADLTRLRHFAQHALNRPVSGDEALDLAERLFSCVACGCAQIQDPSGERLALDEVTECED